MCGEVMKPRRVSRSPNFCEDGGMEMRKTAKTYSPEVKEGAIRRVGERLGEPASRRAAIFSISSKIGGTGQTLRHWARQAERDRGGRADLATECLRLRALERENHELCQSNEMLCKASAYFAAAELGRWSKI